MLSKKYTPTFYSSERLSALAKLVSDTDSVGKKAINDFNNSDLIINNNVYNKTPLINSPKSLINPMFSKQNVDEILNCKPCLNTVIDKNSLTDNNTKFSNNNSIMFTATSAGFNCGNFSEFKLDNKICLPRDKYKRGITVLYLVNDLKNYHAWNFDFYNSYTKLATNRNFISLLRKLPGNTYFAMSIKDDAYKNLFEGTKNFLSRIIGCKLIWKLKYRNSWCAIIYKKTDKYFEVVSESHNPGGIAFVEYSIDKNNLNQNQNYIQQSSTPLINNQIFSQSIIESSDTINTKNEKYSQKEQLQNINIDIDKIIQNLTKDVKELKNILLEQTKLINQLIEYKKNE